MDGDLDAGTTVVLYADADSSAHESVESHLTGGASTVVESVSSIAAAEARLERPGERIDCVVVGDALEDGTGIELIRTLTDREPSVPSILFPSTADGLEASDALESGATDYVPATKGYETLRSRIEEAVAAAERRRERERQLEILRALREALSLSIYVKDTDARYVWRWSTEENVDGADVVALGKTDPEIWGEKFGRSAKQAYEDDLEVIATGEPIFDKEEYHPAAEGPVWMRTTKVPWYGSDGEIRGVIGYSRHVTEQKERELELRHQAEQYEQFASFVSHDLRNPVSIAQGYLERYRESGDESAIDEIEWALTRMDSLIEDLLTMVRNEDHDREEPVGLRELVERTWESIDTAEATLELDVAPSTSVVAVDGLVQQLFQNLFRNAVEHAGPDVTVSVGTTDRGFYVADDGPGIDVEDDTDVFEYGYTEGGTGVGLTIVRETAEAHDWTVTQRAGADGGAHFDVAGCTLITPRLTDRTEIGTHDLHADRAIGGSRPGSWMHDEHHERWVLEGGGADMYFDIDEHYFVYTELEGNARIEARVLDMEPVHEYSKAGPMVRSAPETGTPFGMIDLTPSHGTEVISRDETDQEIQTCESRRYNGSEEWYRIDRVGSTLTFFTSNDGESWNAVAQRPAELGERIAIGLAVCSHDPNRTCSAVFENVRIAALDGPTN